ncbi:hypothetical protein DMC14_001080 [Metamycoplasma phocicerebrale]|uniref:Uncharacterized protein n=1 Tax=Metamycoplasma phocicerebrale TaxID=142649 RepID=A0A3T0TTH6_9BACT|nr:hypothetical protein [Metamycoplasma phocicerebrale]AZZ65385.1 hypothetical protein DMC14_001080 [Metamycoplasma phocicerebrale]
MESEANDNLKKAKALCLVQFIFGSFFIALLAAFIGVLLAIYLPNKKTITWTSNFAYIFITMWFIVIILILITNSIFGIKYAKSINDKKLEKLFMYSAIFIIPIFSLFSGFQAATLLLNKISFKRNKTKKVKNKKIKISK